MNTSVFTSHKDPIIDRDDLARANREWQARQPHAIPCGVPVPDNYTRDMPHEELWAWMRAQENFNR